MYQKPPEMKHILSLLFSFLLLSHQAFGATEKTEPQSLSKRLDSLLADTLLAHSEVGVIVYDLTDDSLLYSYQADKLYRPASIQKVLTAVTALKQLGPDYTFNTTLFHTGTITTDSLLQGNLYIVGGFDPLTNHLDIEAFAQAVRQTGIRHIKGRLIGNASLKDSLKWGSGWCWDDGMPILTPLLSERTDSFLVHLRRSLLQQGVTFTDTTDTLVATAPDSILHQIAVSRRPLTQIMNRMMKKSDNLHAEAVFYQLASAYAQKPYATASDGAKMIHKLIKEAGHRPSLYRVADGSGVSLYNYLSPKLMLDVLRYAYDRPEIFQPLYLSLPISGIDGTLKNRMKKTAAYRRVRAKTGTLTGVISLAGYAETVNKHTLAFVIINQNTLQPGPTRKWQDKVCEAICQE